LIVDSGQDIKVELLAYLKHQFFNQHFSGLTEHRIPALRQARPLYAIAATHLNSCHVLHLVILQDSSKETIFLKPAAEHRGYFLGQWRNDIGHFESGVCDESALSNR